MYSFIRKAFAKACDSILEALWGYISNGATFFFWGWVYLPKNNLYRMFKLKVII